MLHEQQAKRDIDAAAAAGSDYKPSLPSGQPPSSGVFDKRGYLQQLRANADKARRQFEVLSKTDASIAGENEEKLQALAKKAIRLYKQVILQSATRS